MESVGLPLAVLGTMLLTSWGLTRVFPAVRTLAATSSGRFASLDGLRGLLASCVLVHHAVIGRRFFADGSWQAPEGRFERFAGDGAVALFFMITGLLFWEKALAGDLRFGPLMRSRLRRILPMQAFMFGVVIVLCVVIGRSQGLPFSAARAAEGLGRWVGRGYLGEPVIGGVRALTVDAGVTWSLTIEWLYYLALVPLAGLVRTTPRFVVLAAGVLATAVFFRVAGRAEAAFGVMQWLPLLAGMACAIALRRIPKGMRLDRPVVSLAVVAATVIVVGLYRPGRYQILNLALAPAFLAIVLGNSVFGLLRRPASRWLGHVSFGVYLLHGIVLLGVLRVVNASRPVATLATPAYLALAATVGALTVLAASAAHFAIERRFFGIRKGVGPTSFDPLATRRVPPLG